MTVLTAAAEDVLSTRTNPPIVPWAAAHRSYRFRDGFRHLHQYVLPESAAEWLRNVEADKELAVAFESRPWTEATARTDETVDLTHIVLNLSWRDRGSYGITWGCPSCG